MKTKTLLQKVNPYLGSWEYCNEKEDSPKRMERFRATLEAGALLLAPGGCTYITKKLGERLEEKKKKRILYPVEERNEKLANNCFVALEAVKIYMAGLASYCISLHM